MSSGDLHQSRSADRCLHPMRQGDWRHMVTYAMKDERRNVDFAQAGSGVVAGGCPALALPGQPGLTFPGAREPAKHFEDQPPATEDSSLRRVGTGCWATRSLRTAHCA